MFSIITTHNPTEFDAYFESTNFEIKVIADSDTGKNLDFEIEVRGHYFSLAQVYKGKTNYKGGKCSVLICSYKWMEDNDSSRMALGDKNPYRQVSTEIVTEFFKELTALTGETPLQSFVSCGKDFDFEEARSVFGRAMNNVVGEQKYSYLFA